MSVIWSGITEEGAVVPVQVDVSGRVIATASVPDEYVLKSGDTMTGPLELSGDPQTDLQAATKKYVDSAASASGQLFSAGGTSAAGSTLSYGINCSEIKRIEDGVYQVYFTEPASSPFYMVSVAPTNRNRIWRISELSPESFFITFQTVVTGTADTNYSFAVFGPFPLV